MIITNQTITRHRAVVQTGYTRKDQRSLDAMDLWCRENLARNDYSVDDRGDISVVRTYSFKREEDRDRFVAEFAHLNDGIRGDEDDGRGWDGYEEEEEAA